MKEPEEYVDDYSDELSELPAEGATGDNWLDHMHDLLEWRVLTPKAWVPYGKTLSDAVLQELSENKEILLRHVKLRGIFSGDELVLLAGLDRMTPRTLVITTDHPNISSLSKGEIFAYLQRRGIFALIDGEMTEAQRRYKEELDRRRTAKKARRKLKA